MVNRRIIRRILGTIASVIIATVAFFPNVLREIFNVAEGAVGNELFAIATGVGGTSRALLENSWLYIPFELLFCLIVAGVWVRCARNSRTPVYLNTLLAVAFGICAGIVSLNVIEVGIFHQNFPGDVFSSSPHPPVPTPPGPTRTAQPQATATAMVASTMAPNATAIVATATPVATATYSTPSPPPTVTVGPIGTAG